MTREEVIGIIENKLHKYPDILAEQTENEALEIAIKALQQESCEDAVNRILKRMWNCRGKNTTSIDKVKMEQIIRDELPPVTQKQKIGRWIKGKYRDDDIRYNDSSYKCDKCSRIVDFKENYCPNCGAKMTESEE